MAALVIWKLNSINIADIDHFKRVQRRPTNLVQALCVLSYPQQLDERNIPGLLFRRTRGDLTETERRLHVLSLHFNIFGQLVRGKLEWPALQMILLNYLLSFRLISFTVINQY